jgi:hypothetical protein
MALIPDLPGGTAMKISMLLRRQKGLVVGLGQILSGGIP